MKPSTTAAALLLLLLAASSLAQAARVQGGSGSGGQDNNWVGGDLIVALDAMPEPLLAVFDGASLALKSDSTLLPAGCRAQLYGAAFTPDQGELVLTCATNSQGLIVLNASCEAHELLPTAATLPPGVSVMPASLVFDRPGTAFMGTAAFAPGSVLTFDSHRDFTLAQTLAGFQPASLGIDLGSSLQRESHLIFFTGNNTNGDSMVQTYNRDTQTPGAAFGPVLHGCVAIPIRVLHTGEVLVGCGSCVMRLNTTAVVSSVCFDMPPLVGSFVGALALSPDEQSLYAQVAALNNDTGSQQLLLFKVDVGTFEIELNATLKASDADASHIYGMAVRGSYPASQHWCNPLAACCGSNFQPLPATYVCRNSTGPCDLPATCTGVDGSCPANKFKPATTMCRNVTAPLTYPCEAPAMCTGTSAQCPEETFYQPNSTVCRLPTHACESPAKCTGSSIECPSAVEFAPNTTVCRNATAPCEVPTKCTGASLECPGIAFAPNTTVCRNATGCCGLPSMCSGSSSECGAPRFAPNTTVCRNASADTPCQLAAKCTGTSDECPVVFAPNTTVCRNASRHHPCERPAKCTGASGYCPESNPLAPNTTVCRNASCDCELPAKCTGLSRRCPVNPFAPKTKVCRNATAPCEKPAKCTGKSYDCPNVNPLAPNGTVCRNASSSCEFPAKCTGKAKSCPAAKRKPQGTTCAWNGPSWHYPHDILLGGDEPTSDYPTQRVFVAADAMAAQPASSLARSSKWPPCRGQCSKSGDCVMSTSNGYGCCKAQTVAGGSNRKGSYCWN